MKKYTKLYGLFKNSSIHGFYLLILLYPGKKILSGRPRGVMVKVLVYGIVVREFELQFRNYLIKKIT